MEPYRDMIIPFVGLKPGIHQYRFDIDGSFFENFEGSEIGQGKVNIDCQLDRQARMLVFDFDIKGVVSVPCDRCLEDYDQPVEGHQRLIVKYGEEHQEETDEILVITEQEYEIDLRQFVYEYIYLMLPFRKVHGTDDKGRSLCNPEVEKYIAPDENEDLKTDPRWDDLKKLDRNK